MTERQVIAKAKDFKIREDVLRSWMKEFSPYREFTFLEANAFDDNREGMLAAAILAQYDRINSHHPYVTLDDILEARSNLHNSVTSYIRDPETNTLTRDLDNTPLSPDAKFLERIDQGNTWSRFNGTQMIYSGYNNVQNENGITVIYEGYRPQITDFNVITEIDSLRRARKAARRFPEGF